MKTKHIFKDKINHLFSGKTVVIALTGLLIGFTSLAKANEAPKTKAIEVDVVVKTIKEHVKFPNFTINEQQSDKVNVVFTVNDAGQVNLVIANTSNLILKKSIEDQFLKLSLKQLKANNAYSIQFNFKTI